jgi:hypothetical protein
LRKDAKFGFLARPGVQATLGAAAGLGLGEVERRALKKQYPEEGGVGDLTPWGKATLWSSNAVMGLMLGHPRIRSKLLQTERHVGGGLKTEKLLGGLVEKTTPIPAGQPGAGEWVRESGLARTISLPFVPVIPGSLTVALDNLVLRYPKQAWQSLREGLTPTESLSKALSNYTQDVGEESLGVLAKEMGISAGAVAAVGTLGGLSGYLFGRIAAHKLFPDSEELSYDERKARDRKRATTSVAFAVLGALGSSGVTAAGLARHEQIIEGWKRFRAAQERKGKPQGAAVGQAAATGARGTSTGVGAGASTAQAAKARETQKRMQDYVQRLEKARAQGPEAVAKVQQEQEAARTK